MNNRKRIGNTGDRSPAEGSRYVYAGRDETDDPYMEVVCEIYDVPEGEPRFFVYRFDLERFKLLTKDDRRYLVAKAWRPNWPHSFTAYDEWFHKDLEAVAESCGTTLTKLRQCFCSEDPLERAFAWCCVGDYHGFENLDSYPLHLTEAELEARYADES